MNAKQQTWIVRSSVPGAALALALWAAPAAAAITATVTAGVHLRAGPQIVYPSVVILQPGTVVQVFGCEEGYNWCDVQLGADRGWVDAAFLQAPLPAGPVIVSSNAVALGVPTVSFVFNTYWGNYYSARPWYARRAYYYGYWGRYPHGRPPPIYGPPPIYRPPPSRPPAVVRPTPPPRPPGSGRPPSGGKPPGGGKPPAGKPPPPSTRPSPGTGQ